jgi:hypothetical protein
MNWKSARNYLQLNSEKCSIAPLPEVKLAKSDDYDSSNVVEPLKIAFASKSSTDGSGDWVEIASSGPIISSTHKKNSQAQLKFTWRDQGKFLQQFHICYISSVYS